MPKRLRQDKQEGSDEKLLPPAPTTGKQAITPTTSDSATTTTSDDVLDYETRHSPSSDQTILVRINEKLNQMAQAFITPYAIPDVAQYPHLRFDGDSVSGWIEQVTRIFKRARLNNIQKITEVPYWTRNETYQKRVKAVVNHLDDWNAATKALKSTFAIRDPSQLRGAYDRLKDLEKQPLLSNPLKIYTYCLNHEIQVEETKDTARVPSDLDCTRGLFQRIHGHSLEDIISKGKITYEELFKMEYPQAQKLVRG
ncbi:uncharacterized protein BCR38DRAFT_497360 [Pseudomassariella vexata]|uniref:Uncharacterized protein n=1 Tax=Pseudomassariella vexata TaxID=1141098 RepID=A0A1Y2DKX3_9PEZI|nr:uncharacterized protein BCR38DRAFT_497360 [Pseudomassariella vexata]ORY59938.1 hypothetical protein BCR38DRAFT_497360 [Pseudomassariella vexata]